MSNRWDVVRIVDEVSLDFLVDINNQPFTHPWTRGMFLEELGNLRSRIYWLLLLEAA